MKKLFITIFVFFGSLACSANPPKNENDRCKVAQVAISEVMNSKKYDDSAVKKVFQSSKATPGCDDGFHGEGFSDIVAKSLATDFTNVIGSMSKDKSLKEFVMKHVDATADWIDLDKITSNSGKACPKSEKVLCKLVGEKAAEASKEAKAAARE